MIADKIVDAIEATEHTPSKVLVSPNFMHLLLTSEGLHPPGAGEHVYVAGVPLELSTQTETFILVYE